MEVRDRNPHLQAHHLLSISQPAAHRHYGCELPNLLRLQIFSSLATPIMNRCERSDVPFVPSQTAHPDGGRMVTLPSASRLSAEGGGNQAITVLSDMSEAFAPVAAIVTSPRICRTAHPTEAACLHTASADVMAITESSISFARPGLADSRHSCCAHTVNSCAWARNQQTTGVSGYALSS